MTDALSCFLYLIEVDDRNPKKSLMCARDVMQGIMQPWHVNQQHKSKMDVWRSSAEDLINSQVNEGAVEKVSTMLDDAIKLAREMANDADGLRQVYPKLDCARYTLQCIRAKFLEQC